VSPPAAEPGGSIEERAALALDLRRAGVRDVAVMRAIERTPRERFAPRRFRDLAARNIALPLACGQTMPAAADLGRRIEALGVAPEHRVLEIGAGSGYGAAILGQLAREVVSLERYRSLATEASARLAAQRVANARVLFADGLAPDRALGVFDRILVHVAVAEPPRALVEMLAPGGVMVFGRAAPAARRWARLMRLRRGASGEELLELGRCSLPLAAPGMAERL
jgi:protein-L-isoaspartate(D-aspartate) O-methyltransferase